MSIETEKYARTTFYVDAVQVTAENMEDVAKWCGGELATETRQGRRLVRYIKVDVNNPMSERQTKAFIGNWVLKGGTGFKVYTDKAFQGCFQKVLPAPTAEDIWRDDLAGVTPKSFVQTEALFEAPEHNDIGTRR